MTAITRPIRRIFGRSMPEATTVATPEPTAPTVEQPGVAVDIPETDPLFAYLQSAPGPVDLTRLELASPALEELREAGVALVVPLVTQGELIGTLNLGPRLSEQDYSTDDRRLLATLAAQAAPAIRVAQLVREQAAEAAERERFEQELKVAQLIQQQFLPRELPNLPEWQIAAYYGPARVVGGDFYDFIDLGEGRIGVVVGDVTDKGVPAALVMARTHSILRAEAPRLVEPGKVLARANELLAPEMPARMFVTCLYGVLEPATGRFVFANAGHNLPYVRTADGVIELRATGLPLGLMPDIVYEETEGFVGQGEAMLLYSDGLVEQHGPGREMYGFPRLREAMATDDAGSALLDRLLEELNVHGTRHGAGGRHHAGHPAPLGRHRRRRRTPRTGPSARDPRRAEAERCPRRRAAARVHHRRRHRQRAGRDAAGGRSHAPLSLEPARLERLKTAVAETVMNAIEYGSQGDPAVPVDVHVDADDETIHIRVTDRALSGPIPDAEMPDLDAKLEGRQKPRGWGLFLIRHMVDGMDVHAADGLQIVTLTIARDGR